MDYKGSSSHDIAIIGMACVYPGAHSPEELWQNVLAGRRYFRKTPPERLPLSDYFDPDPEAPGKTYSDQMALITGWSFDPLKFRIPPVTANATDIAHWIALSTAGAALADAQIDLNLIDRERVGVILGNTLTGEFSRSHTLRFRWPYVERSIRRAMSHNRFPSGQIDAVVEATQAIYNAPLPEITEDSLSGNMSNTIAGRICNHFDFGGGGFTIDGACSSSLLSVLHACNAILQGDMDIALAGGVDISLDPFEIVGFAKTKALAVDDIRPYDERAAGMLPGEGCGIIVLVRGDYAREAGLPVRAFIKGYGYSSDGRGGITAPIVEGQMRALQRTYERAGYPISTVGLFEGHGTGTTLGDKIEIESLRRMIESSPDHGFCWLGTIKGNFGHCKAAAGVAGLIKAVMALKRKIIPPTMNCEQPNPLFGRPMGRLRPTVRGTIWPAGDIPRRASVSAMGFGGSNSHVTLEEANPEEQPSREDMDLLGSYQKHELILFSAESPEELQRKAEQLARVAERISRAELTDLSAALSHAPQAGSLRLAIVTDAPWELAAALRRILGKISEGAGIKDLDDPETGIFAGEPLENPSFVALFPGQGSQFLNMGEYWFRRNPFVYSLFSKADKAIQDILPHGLKPYMLYNPFATDEESARGSGGLLRDTRIAQPAIVLSSIATLKVLNDLGLRPDTVIGHSLGEITALHAAGAMNDVTAIRIAALRGRAMASLKLDDPGGMAAVFASPEKIKPIMEPFQASLTISNFNSPGQTVVSGTTAAIKGFVRLCKEQDIPCQQLPVSHAFHSEIVAPAAESLRKALGGVTFEKMSSKVISTSTGTAIDDNTDLKSLLGDQIRKPVRLTEAVLEAAEQRPALWVEVGPKGVLTSLLREIMGDNTFECFTTDIAGEDGSRLLNSLIARAFVLGFPLVMDRLFANRFYRPFSIDNYNPSFIVNPCERPVHEKDLPPVASRGGMPSALFPDELSNADFQGYLEDRSAFVRELISLDYHHYTGGGVRRITRESAATHAGPPPKISVPVEEKTADRESMMTFVIDWISKRTGYPTSSISPEMKLRDDLNLDSIKAGELAIILSRKFGGTFTSDSTSFANAPLSALIDSLHIDRAAPHGETPDVKGEITLKETGRGLPDRIRTFMMGPLPAPFDLETKLPPLAGTVMIVSRADDPRAKAIAGVLKATGLIPVMAEGNGIAPDLMAKSDITAAIIIADEQNKTFFDCTHSEFESRVDGLASHLFITFQTVLEHKGPGFRALVLRPVSGHDDDTMDLDAGAGFLKTLSLEYPGAHFKWVALPAEWTGGQWADTALQELQVSGKRVLYRYSNEGHRTTEAAVPAYNRGTASQPLRADDVIIVTGGAKGITFELCLGLARKTGVKLALFGSSPEPEKTTNAQGNEMLANFAILAGEGITFRYVQCDVTDEAAVQRAVRSVEKDLGPVTGLLHGAGFSRLKLFRDMDREGYLRCIRVKTLGLYHLITSVDPGRLKIIHVVSSILGKTGMKGQADYTFANAWMDYALSRLQKSYPEIHCLSLGYSVWAETGLGKKLGAVKSLSSLGITPIGTVEGVSAYLNLTDRTQKGSTFVITGRMTPELEWNLFPPLEAERGRFLEKLYRWIPGGEVVAEAVLSQASDLYLPEHVYQGTTIFPGVMAIEAMVEAAMLCTGRADLPFLRDIQFKRPVIVPEGSEVILRTQAVADLPDDDRITVRVIIRSDADGFQENYFEADCLFGQKAKDAEGEPVCPPLPEILPIDPESFNPSPLFQGKFFRRISAVRKLEAGKESITDVAVPVGERYFSASLRKSVVTPSPAVRDAFLQSGALLLPPGYLPVKISELNFHHRLRAGASVLCHSRGMEQNNNTYIADISVFARDGKLLETLQGIVLEKPLRQDPAVIRRAADPIPLLQLEQELKELIAGIPHAISIMEQDPAGKQLNALVTDSELERIHREVPAPRQKSASANLAAARRAAVRFAETYLGLTLSPLHIHLSSRPDGMPELSFDKPSMTDEFRGIGVSLSDSGGISVALVGPAPIGVDIQIIETRDAEMWRALLGADGYSLARRLVSEAAEPFDRTASRVWTMIEAVKKANSLKLLLPADPAAISEPWISLRARQNGHTFDFLSTTIDAAVDSGRALALTVVMDTEQVRARVRENLPAADNASLSRETDEAASLQLQAYSDEGPESVIDKALSDMLNKLRQAEELCMDDPDNPSVEEHFRLFEQVFVNTMSVLRKNELLLPPQVVLEKKRWMYKLIRNYWGESIVFRRTLEKPLGYPGDHLLLDAMFHNKVDAKGIGYHFDRYFLSYPGTEGVRQRSYWVVDRLESLLSERKMRHLTLLDLGCGPMAIEKTLLERAAPDRTFRFIGLDFDDRALNYAKSRLTDPRVDIRMKQQNLVSVEGLSEIQRNAADADVCICMGLIEYLEDETVAAIFDALYKGCDTGTRILTSNYQPDHYARPAMEWLLDWWLVYRTEPDLRRLAHEAGFENSRIRTQLDPTGSIVLMEIEK